MDKKERSYLKQLSDRYYNNEELTKEERSLIFVGNIRINAIKCLICEDIIQSEHRHDFKYCSCGNVFIDGGSWYQRIGGIGVQENGYEDLTVMYKDVEEEEY
jgi:hypothetical protein